MKNGRTRLHKKYRMTSNNVGYVMCLVRNPTFRWDDQWCVRQWNTLMTWRYIYNFVYPSNEWRRTVSYSLKISLGLTFYLIYKKNTELKEVLYIEIWKRESVEPTSWEIYSYFKRKEQPGVSCQQGFHCRKCSSKTRSNSTGRMNEAQRRPNALGSQLQ
jgi:hypothetical protein